MVCFSVSRVKKNTHTHTHTHEHTADTGTTVAPMAQVAKSTSSQAAATKYSGRMIANHRERVRFA